MSVKNSTQVSRRCAQSPFDSSMRRWTGPEGPAPLALAEFRLTNGQGDRVLTVQARQLAEEAAQDAECAAIGLSRSEKRNLRGLLLDAIPETRASVDLDVVDMNGGLDRKPVHVRLNVLDELLPALIGHGSPALDRLAVQVEIAIVVGGGADVASDGRSVNVHELLRSKGCLGWHL